MHLSSNHFDIQFTTNLLSITVFHISNKEDTRENSGLPTRQLLHPKEI